MITVCLFKEIRLKEMTSQTVGGLFSTLHLVACMESNNWLMNRVYLNVFTDG